MEITKNKKAEHTKPLKKAYKKLGFTYLETAEIIVALNDLFVNYQVHYHKLRSFHWNVNYTRLLSKTIKPPRRILTKLQKGYVFLASSPN